MMVFSNQRLFVHVSSSAGHEHRRFTIALFHLQYLFLAVVIFMLLTSLAFWRLYQHSADMAFHKLLTSQNHQLEAILEASQERLLLLKPLHYQSTVDFELLWNKSGLGVSPHLLEQNTAGESQPFLATAETTAQSDAATVLLQASENDLFDVLSMTIENANNALCYMDRLFARGQDIQRLLSETMEYFFEAETVLSNTPSIRPARTPWLSSSFGKRRDPISHHWVMHKGLDLAGNMGTKIIAPADGIVIWTGRRGGYGQTVVLDHGYGLQTHFAHLSRYWVKSGERVRRGDLIAEMGSTGKSTGPHLHYEVRRLGEPLDPRRFILD